MRAYFAPLRDKGVNDGTTAPPRCNNLILLDLYYGLSRVYNDDHASIVNLENFII